MVALKYLFLIKINKYNNNNAWTFLTLDRITILRCVIEDHVLFRLIVINNYFFMRFFASVIIDQIWFPETYWIYLNFQLAGELGLANPNFGSYLRIVISSMHKNVNNVRVSYSLCDILYYCYGFFPVCVVIR